jgi:SnoaL-like domain
MNDGTLREMAARIEIVERIHDYCRGVDRGDAELMNSVFWPGATIVHPPFDGHAEEFCAAALEFIKLVEVSWHVVNNVSVKFDGDMAYTEAYFTGYHRFANVAKTEGLIANVLLPHRKEGTSEDHFVGGRFINWFKRRGDEWRVVHHIGFREWERWDPAADRYPIPGMGRRDHSDPFYLRRKD